MEDLFKVFDSWEHLEKSRKAKGLSKWSGLAHIAGKLEGKSKKDITFTCAHPDHPGETHVLGSVLGNLHCLLGYINPGFHFAPYHLQIMDPHLSDEDAAAIYKLSGHPSRPELWELSGLEPVAEGDLSDGEPHPSFAAVKDRLAKKRSRDEESITVSSGTGTYTAIPSESLVYGDHNGHIYHWSMVKDSFFAAENTELTEKMNKQDVTTVSKALLSDALLYAAKESDTFDSDVYDFVKSQFPVPGSVIPLASVQDEVVYGVVKSDRLEFFDKLGATIQVPVYDRSYQSFDLRKGGDVHPSVLQNFVNEYMPGLALEASVPSAPVVSESVIKGSPSPGFSQVEESRIDSYEKSIEVVGNTFRLILKEPS